MCIALMCRDWLSRCGLSSDRGWTAASCIAACGTRGTHVRGMLARGLSDYVGSDPTHNMLSRPIQSRKCMTRKTIQRFDLVQSEQTSSEVEI